MKPRPKYMTAIALLLLALALVWYRYASDSPPETTAPADGHEVAQPQAAGAPIPPREPESITSAPAGQVEPGGPASVFGIVTRADTGEPITHFRIAYLDRVPGSRAQWRGILGADGPDAGLFGQATVQWKETVSSEGRFEIHDIPGNQSFAVAVKAELFEPTYVSVPAIEPATSVDDLVIALEPVTGFEGRVVDMNGSPIAGAVVHVGESDAGRMLARSDETGYFRALEIEEAPLTIFVYHPEHLPAVLTVFPRPREIVEVQIQLNAGGRIAGVVRLGNDPAANAQVTLSDARQVVKAVRTDTQGRYSIAGIPSGEFLLTVLNPDNRDDVHRKLTRQAVVEEGLVTRADFDFLVSAGSISGVIVIGENVATAGLVQAELYSETGDFSTMARVQSDGAYQIEGLPGGRVQLKVMAEGADGVQRGRQLEIELADGEQRQEDIEFVGSGSIVYTVTNFPTGMKAMMMLLRGSETIDVNNPNQLAGLQERTELSALLAESGTFQLSEIEPGEYTLVVFPADVNPRQVFDRDIRIYPITVEDGTPTTLSIEY